MNGECDLLVTGTPAWETAALVDRLPDDERVDLSGIEGVLAGARQVVHGGGGSAANVAVAAARAGLRVTFAGRVGDDEDGRRCRDALAAAGVDAQVALAPGRRTKRSVILVEAGTGRQRFRVDLPAGMAPPMGVADLDNDRLRSARWMHLDRASEAAPAWLDRRGDRPASLDLHDLPLRETARARLARVLPGLACLQVREGALQGLADLVRGGTGPTVRRGDVIGPQDSGGRLPWIDPPPLSDAIALEAARTVADGVPIVAVTRGARGAIVARRDDPPIVRPAVPVKEFLDATGAGDAFAAAMIGALLRGEAIETAMDAALRAGARACRWLGAREPA